VDLKATGDEMSDLTRMVELERATPLSTHTGLTEGLPYRKNEGVELNPKGSLMPEKSHQESQSNLGRGTIRIGTWNVRTMLRRGKLENVKHEMGRMKINVLGLSEVRWKEAGDFMSDKWRVVYSGGQESQRGVAIILGEDLGRRVRKVVQ
jgi:hypothetical protein